MLFVAKKQDRQRMIIDGRPAIRLFADPPGVSLITVESMAKLHVKGDRVFF